MSDSPRRAKWKIIGLVTGIFVLVLAVGVRQLLHLPPVEKFIAHLREDRMTDDEPTTQRQMIQMLAKSMHDEPKVDLFTIRVTFQRESVFEYDLTTQILTYTVTPAYDGKKQKVTTYKVSPAVIRQVAAKKGTLAMFAKPLH